MFDAKSTMDPTTKGTKAIGYLLGGGIRPGSLLIIDGESRAGKSVVCQHLVYGGLISGSLTAYYVTDANQENLIREMESFDMQVMYYYDADKLRVYSVSYVCAVKNVCEALIAHITNLPQRFNLVVIDSLTPFLNRIKVKPKIDIFLTFKSMCVGGRSIVLITDTHIYEKSTFHRALSMSDYYLRLNSNDKILWSGIMEGRSIKSMEILKQRGVELRGGEKVEFEIKPRIGIQILPFCKVRI